jgi:hypothetical protein
MTLTGNAAFEYIISFCSGKASFRLHASLRQAQGKLSMSGFICLKTPIPLVLSVSKYERMSIPNRN